MKYLRVPYIIIWLCHGLSKSGPENPFGWSWLSLFKLSLGYHLLVAALFGTWGHDKFENDLKMKPKWKPHVDDPDFWFEEGEEKIRERYRGRSVGKSARASSDVFLELNMLTFSAESRFDFLWWFVKNSFWLVILMILCPAFIDTYWQLLTPILMASDHVPAWCLIASMLER